MADPGCHSGRGCCSLVSGAVPPPRRHGSVPRHSRCESAAQESPLQVATVPVSVASGYVLLRFAGGLVPQCSRPCGGLPVRRLACVVPRPRTLRCDSVPRAAVHVDDDPHAVLVVAPTAAGFARLVFREGPAGAGRQFDWGSMTQVSSPVNMFLDTSCLIVGCGDRKCSDSGGLRPVKKNWNSPGFRVRRER
jgi:hypothetical protein